ncbi:MAG: ATP-dependent helicase [Candidatus Levybacteria bacterium CG_4_10_14_0_8_um_filter_35_23]|nr:MAG: ATP-dependent helicase [Candidatus Levybacteria bacterium CG_4_10_14_0_8_um_filter_35_23]
MRNTYRVKTYRTFAPKPPNAQLMNAIRNSRYAQKSDVPEVLFVAKNAFNDFNICDELKTNIKHKEYNSPTPIQDQTIPAILEGKDVIGIANTGTGKTAAFLIPLIDKVFKNKNRSEKVFILAPTRELAVQINDELKDFTSGMRISSVLCIGGANMYRQKGDLRRNPDFVIGTPGRIKDFIQHRALNLSHFNNVVLDEADRMVDIGFITDIKYFISLLPTNRQSLFFSATISGRVKEILAGFVKNPVTVTVKQHDIEENIRQDIIRTTNKGKKVDQLHDLLTKEGFDKVLIFGRTKWGVQKLADELLNRGFKAGAIHGNKGQNQRQRILNEFKQNEINILLATDVASRGLDIPDVSHVINYDMPATYDDYVHRIGRTGRANKKGIALTFVDSY